MMGSARGAGSRFDELEPGLAEQFLHFGFGPVVDRLSPCHLDRSHFSHLHPLLLSSCHKAALKMPRYNEYRSATVT
jgi:hypothetical protein